MPKYNYGALSPQDFEEISRDLLQAEWNVALEAFKQGRDTGIDLRYAALPDETVVVQCKHFWKSGFSALLGHLRTSELPKIKKLNPNRYVVMTTVELSPDNKAAILQALAPFVKSPSDIFGAGDLDGLLARHPCVERANFKLWLTSVSVIERILHNAEVCKTEFEVDRIRRKLPLFVQNQAYPQAQEILSTTRILVISGPPGIGKTTLAEMLMYSSLEEGFDPVVIEANIAEGQRMYRRGARQIFYYDDFLGQTFLGDRREYFGQNQDKAVVNFMEMVRQSPDAKFILTTREHILSSAIRLSERLDASTLIRDRMVLTLGHYNFGDRARILYNHLYFSELSIAHKNELLRGNFFLRIIRHSHFNPRLIEWLADLSRVGAVPAEYYRSYVEGLLDNPEKIWDHAFRTQISEAGRCLLLALYTDGGQSLLGLKATYSELRGTRAKRYNLQTEPNEFEANLKILEGGFVAVGSRGVSYLNPSVKEYVASVISGDPETWGDVLDSAIRFRQVATLWRIAKVAGSAARQALARHRPEALIAKLMALAQEPTYDWTTSEDGKWIGHLIDYDTEERLGFLAEFCDAEFGQSGLDGVYTAMEEIITEWSPDMLSLWRTPSLVREMAALDRFLVGRGSEIRLQVLDKLLNALPHARSYNWRELVDLPESIPGWRQRDGQKFFDGLRSYMDGGWRKDWDRCEDGYARKQLVQNLTELAQRKTRSQFFAAPLKGACDETAAMAEKFEQPAPGSGSPSKPLTPSSLTDSDVRSMFQTLLLDGS